LTTDLFYHRLRTTAESFISPQLIPDGASIAVLTLPDLTLNKSAKGDWMVSGEKSSDISASTDAIQALLDHWHHKRAVKILPITASDNTKDISITLSDNSEIRFSLVQTDTDLILMRTDLGFQYHLPASAATDLFALSSTSGNN